MEATLALLQNARTKDDWRLRDLDPAYPKFVLSRRRFLHRSLVSLSSLNSSICKSFVLISCNMPSGAAIPRTAIQGLVSCIFIQKDRAKPQAGPPARPSLRWPASHRQPAAGSKAAGVRQGNTAPQEDEYSPEAKSPVQKLV